MCMHLHVSDAWQASCSSRSSNFSTISEGKEMEPLLPACLPACLFETAKGSALVSMKVLPHAGPSLLVSLDSAMPVQVEGPCLVIFKDGTVAQSHVPEADYRLPYAMETHAVNISQLTPEPAADSIWYGDPKGAIGIPAQKFLVTFLPGIGLVVAYIAARFAKYLKASPLASQPSQGGF